jgi:hypothetical protein
MNSLNYNTVFVHGLTRFSSICVICGQVQTIAMRRPRPVRTVCHPHGMPCVAHTVCRVSPTRYAVCHAHGMPCVTHTVCRVSRTWYAVLENSMFAIKKSLRDDMLVAEKNEITIDI